MTGRDEILSLLKQAIVGAPADQIELVYDAEELSLTHIAQSQIQQNVHRNEATVAVRVVVDGKFGVASTGKPDIENIRSAINDGVAFARLKGAEETEAFLPASGTARSVNAFFEQTAMATPAERANAIWQINKIAGARKLTTAGAFQTAVNRVAVLNSLGTEQYFEGTSAEFSLTVSGGDDLAGYAIGYDRNAANINPGELGETAVDKALHSADPVSLPSGKYTVILEPAALGQLVLFLAFMGFGSRTLVQRRSFMAGKIGEQISSEIVTIRDDAFDPRMQGMPFDYEGVPRKVVELITNGVARGVVSNSADAKILGMESTGHAHIATKNFSPYPKHMVMEGGNNSIGDLIASIEDGVYITHFWYVNYLNPMQTMVTGLTRDGTFRIQQGNIGAPIVDMRMNQSILEALVNCRALSTERKLYPQYSVVMLMPYALIDDFQLDEEGA